MCCVLHIAYIKTKKPLNERLFFSKSDPVGTRTQDPYIKSVLLYQLSYGIVCLRTTDFLFNQGAKIRI